MLGRAALVHDVGRVAVPARVGRSPGRCDAGDWERVRLHPYHTDRILSRHLSRVPCAVATAHHERLDGRATTAARLLGGSPRLDSSP